MPETSSEETSSESTKARSGSTSQLWAGLACLLAGALVWIIGYAVGSSTGDVSPLFLLGPLLVLVGFLLLIIGAARKAFGR